MNNFRTNESDIEEIFKFTAKDIAIEEENQIEFSQMENGRIWILTSNYHIIQKTPLEGLNDSRGAASTMFCKDDILNRKPIKKMYVDSRGIHCFFLAENEIYYNNWNSEKVIQITTRSENEVQYKFFKSLDLQYTTANNFDEFEILVGTSDGEIHHAKLKYQSVNDTFEYKEKLSKVIETGDYKHIHDLKIARVGGKQIVLAITDNPTLYQFQGDMKLGRLKGIF